MAVVDKTEGIVAFLGAVILFVSIADGSPAGIWIRNHWMIAALVGALIMVYSKRITGALK